MQCCFLNSIINLSPTYLQTVLFKKSKFESGPEKIIRPEIIVELGVSPVEARLLIEF